MTASKEITAGSVSKPQKVLGTTLAGVLAVGMVPAAGIAIASDEAVADEGDLELLALSPADNFSQGSVTTVTVSSQDEALTPDEKTGAFSTPLSESGSLTVDALTVVTYDKTSVGKDSYDVKVADAEGAEVEKITAPGTYTITVTAKKGSTWAGGTIEATLVVGSIDLNTIKPTAYNVAQTEASKNTISTFVYTGEAQTVGFEAIINEKETFLEEGTDYTVKYYVGTTWVDASQIIEPGTYSALLTGTGTYEGEYTTSVTVATLELNKDYVTVTAGTGNWVYGKTATLPTHPESVTINGVAYTNTTLTSAIDLTYTGVDVTTLGKITGTAIRTEAAKEAKQIYNKQTFTLNRAVEEVTFKYDGAAWPTGKVTITSAWKDDLVTAFVGTKQLKNTSTETTYTLTWKDPDGGTTAPAGTAYGTYKLTVSSVASDNSYGGEATLTVIYTGGTIDCDTNMTVYYGDKNVEDIETIYSGDDVAGEISVTLLDDDGNALSDPTRTFYDADGKKVKEIKDAGTYTLEVTKDGYELTNNTVNITVSPVTITGLQLTNDSPMQIINGGWAFEYNDGDAVEDIADALEYTINTADKPNEYAAWSDADEAVTDNFTLTITDAKGKEVAIDKVKDIGTYTATITPTDEKTSNYAVTASSVTFKVAKELTFIDVTTDAWYYEAVETAYANGYMTGYANTKLFGPNDTLTRGQLACVLFNMAGGTATIDYNNYSETEGWNTGFSDVDGKMYYAKAIAWGKQAGVMNGYAGTDEFGPNDVLTREQLACFLANYAKKVGNFEAADTATVLAGYPDGSTVSDWAQENVAWAAANEIIGNSGTLNPLAEVTRAETAAAAVNYQPYKL